MFGPPPSESNPLNFFGVLFFRTFLFSPHRFISFSILFPRTDLIFLRHLHRKKIYRKFGIEFHMFLHASHFHHLNSALGLETTFSQLSKFKLNGWNFYRKRFSIRAFNRGYNFLASLCHHTVWNLLFVDVLNTICLIHNYRSKEASCSYLFGFIPVILGEFLSFFFLCQFISSSR